MKNFILILFTVLSFTSLQAQDLSDKSTSLIACNLFIAGDLYDKLDTYTPSTLREKTTFKKSKKVLNQLVVDHMYSMIIDQLKAEKSITINDKDAMVDGQVIYNEFGYPFPMSAKGGIKKARKNGVEAESYLKININLGGTLDVLGGAKLSKQVKPEMNMTIAFLGTDGKEVKKVKSKLKSKEQIKAKNFPEKKFDKMDDGYMELLFEALQPDMDELVKMAIAKL